MERMYCIGKKKKVVNCPEGFRAGKRYGFRPVVARAVAEGWGRLGLQPPVEDPVVWTPPQSRPPADLRRCDPPCYTYPVNYG